MAIQSSTWKKRCTVLCRLIGPMFRRERLDRRCEKIPKTEQAKNPNEFNKVEDKSIETSSLICCFTR